jgi:TrmH family RNA methyltransferase
VVEGIRIFKEIPAMDIDSVYVSESFVETYINVDKESVTENRYDNIPDLFSRVDYTVVADNVFKKLSDTVNPQGVLAVVRMADYTLDEVLSNRDKENSCIVVLDKIQDPGNLGTIIRSAAAFNVDTVILSPNTVDLYNSKVIRATQGMVFNVNIVVRELIPVIEYLKSIEVPIYGTKVNYGTDARDLKDKDTKSYCLIVGNEGQGVKDEILDKCDSFLHINMNDKVESLNVGVATSILLYELES